jgi:hypothetical protein
MFKPHSLHWLLTATLALSAAACADDHDHDHADESPEAEACEHLSDGPAQAVLAVAAEEVAGLPDISKSHTRFDVTLPGDAGKLAGYVKFVSTKSGDTLLVANADVPMQLVDGTGAAVQPKSEATSQAGCAAVKRRAVYTLGVATYRLKLGPTATSTVGLLFEAL